MQPSCWMMLCRAHGKLLGCAASHTRLELLWLLFRDPKSTFLILELQSVSILTLLSMATETKQCHLCLVYPLVVLVKGLLRPDHLNQWLIAKPSLSHPLHFLFPTLYISWMKFFQEQLVPFWPWY